jgi:hypothetical protein
LPSSLRFHVNLLFHLILNIMNFTSINTVRASYRPIHVAKAKRSKLHPPGLAVNLATPVRQTARHHNGTHGDDLTVLNSVIDANIFKLSKRSQIRG